MTFALTPCTGGRGGSGRSGERLASCCVEGACPVPLARAADACRGASRRLAPPARLHRVVSEPSRSSAGAARSPLTRRTQLFTRTAAGGWEAASSECARPASNALARSLTHAARALSPAGWSYLGGRRGCCRTTRRRGGLGGWWTSRSTWMCWRGADSLCLLCSACHGSLCAQGLAQPGAVLLEMKNGTAASARDASQRSGQPAECIQRLIVHNHTPTVHTPARSPHLESPSREKRWARPETSPPPPATTPPPPPRPLRLKSTTLPPSSSC